MNDIFDGRFARQQELVPAEKLNNLSMSIIGLGAIGRQVALQLAGIGARRIQLIDFDAVDATNVVTQGYRCVDAAHGRPKVEAARLAMRDLSPEIEIDCVADRYRPAHRLGECVFVCVDSISARAAIWRSAGHACKIWCDGRMLGEVIRVLCVTGLASRQHYETTLFQQSQAQRGTCTAHSTIYTANIAAGLMVHQLTLWLRDLEPTSDLVLNLLCSELSVSDTG